MLWPVLIIRFSKFGFGLDQKNWLFWTPYWDRLLDRDWTEIRVTMEELGQNRLKRKTTREHSLSLLPKPRGWKTISKIISTFSLSTLSPITPFPNPFSFLSCHASLMHHWVFLCQIPYHVSFWNILSKFNSLLGDLLYRYSFRYDLLYRYFPRCHLISLGLISIMADNRMKQRLC